ncbi:MAG TPA: hypothetical protein VIO36_14065 [Anaerolineaceae bacterium]
MAFSYTNKAGKKYYLHSRVTQLKSGKDRTIYFFSGSQGDGAIDKVPAGYEVSETRNGLPVLKRKDSK